MRRLYASVSRAAAVCATLIGMVLIGSPANAAAAVPVTKPSCIKQGGTYTHTGFVRTCSVATTGAPELSSGYFYMSDAECSEVTCSCFDGCYTASYKILRTETTTATTTTTRNKTIQSSVSTYDFAVAADTRRCEFGTPLGDPVPLSVCESLNLYDLDNWTLPLSDPFFALMWQPGNPAAFGSI
jgi:hypothetical protein